MVRLETKKAHYKFDLPKILLNPEHLLDDNYNYKPKLFIGVQCYKAGSLTTNSNRFGLNVLQHIVWFWDWQNILVQLKSNPIFASSSLEASDQNLKVNLEREALL